MFPSRWDSCVSVHITTSTMMNFTHRVTSDVLGEAGDSRVITAGRKKMTVSKRKTKCKGCKKGDSWGWFQWTVPASADIVCMGKRLGIMSSRGLTCSVNVDSVSLCQTKFSILYLFLMYVKRKANAIAVCRVNIFRGLNILCALFCTRYYSASESELFISVLHYFINVALFT